MSVNHSSDDKNLPEINFAAKLEAAKPYNIFLTSIANIEATHNEPLSIRFKDLLDKSLGELECSVQINFVVDLEWLMEQYIISGYGETPLLILYGMKDDELEKINKVQGSNIKSAFVAGTGKFGIHHTKISLLGYKDGSMRIIVSTANLYEQDWEIFANGLWISPRLPKTNSSRDSKTGFRQDLLHYLNSYNVRELEEWKQRISETDFSCINVFFIASVPGEYTGTNKSQFGHPRLEKLLSKYISVKNTQNTIIAQSSSIGFLGKKPIKSCVQDEFLRSASGCLGKKYRDPLPDLKIIYPSLDNVRLGHASYEGAGCLGYRSEMHNGQTWVKDLFHQWRSDSHNRTKAMPHIKTYCCIENDNKGLYWFLLTSANLSNGAWGASKFVRDKPKHLRPLVIRNYEAGVLFMPKFILDADLLPLDSSEANLKFPLPYDLPLTRYEAKDTPYLSDLDYENAST